jgi:hypothetical protein
MKSKITIALGAAALLATAVLAQAAPVAVSGQKIDSGLGGLPHYSQWLDKSGRDPMGARVVGESLDNGLGELPHYSQWTDRTGRDPMAGTVTALNLNGKR